MREFIQNINKVFENRVRLGVMSVLMVNDTVDFNTLKDLLQLTDGNLASHLSSLEKYSYIKVNKRFVGKKTQTNYETTQEGRNAFLSHINALEKIIKNTKD